MKYRIFDEILHSNIQLPELPRASKEVATITFCSTTVLSTPRAPNKWFHHWKLKNGEISISVGMKGENYWLKFPEIAYFRISPLKSKIFSYQLADIPAHTIRHLLLDQVIPRLLCHQGKQIIHASCVKIGASAVAFAGESGWGKSTLGAFFHSRNHLLLTDDCLLLQPKDPQIFAIPNYSGLRLFHDSLSLIDQNNYMPATHYGVKNRLIIKNKNIPELTPVRAIFILSDPAEQEQNSPIFIKKISGADAAMELVKNSFPLDITNKKMMGKQVRDLALIAGTETITIFKLSYPRKTDILPAVMTEITSSINSTTNTK